MAAFFAPGDPLLQERAAAPFDGTGERGGGIVQRWQGGSPGTGPFLSHDAFGFQRGNAAFF